ncbi:hypothetical protein GCM10010172_50190 [Paractinoplanes ferrugineus]|uniref:CN hydrolase domain-containing protein n=1 Tax=Paractinoplanes ferrugineus TaxID=113564 RepID=A0A919J8X0_9ACTN|nr:carbon-nitrogen hydrolase family protein [Actinoplanes ferrugineus]GIE15719.1 hypothetical protein Afe05nite_75590 [Actinoplanes ferrugineus]
MRVGACQTAEILGDIDAAVDVILACAEQADVDLLLFPECFLQGYLPTPSFVRDHALALDELPVRLAEVPHTLVLGLIERSGARYFNTAVVLDRGRVLGAYRKRFLTAGESVFTPGDTAPVFECAGVRFGINICYDAQFPAAAAAVAAAGAKVLLLPAQNMMPRDRAPHWQPRHNEIRRLRIEETGMWLVSADVTGVRDDRIGLGPTCVLDPAGRVVAEVPTGTTGVAIAEIEP